MRIDFHFSLLSENILLWAKSNAQRSALGATHKGIPHFAPPRIGRPQYNHIDTEDSLVLKRDFLFNDMQQI